MRPSYLLLLVTVCMGSACASAANNRANSCDRQNIDRLEYPCEWGRSFATCMGSEPEAADLLFAECQKHKVNPTLPPDPGPDGGGGILPQAS